MAQQSEIRYLTAPAIDVKKKKYCRFKKRLQGPRIPEEVPQRTR